MQTGYDRTICSGELLVKLVYIYRLCKHCMIAQSALVNFDCFRVFEPIFSICLISDRVLIIYNNAIK